MIFAALATLTAALGMTAAMVTAALFGMTLHYDYWSNTVELLAVACVLAGAALGWHWGYLVAIGLVLGTGRETLPFLAILGTPQAIALGAGAAIGHLACRLSARTESHWAGTLDYAVPMWRTNWESAAGKNGADVVWRVGIYTFVAALAMMTVPMLAGVLVVVTTLIARVDEPRVLTMLTPFASLTVIRWV